MNFIVLTFVIFAISLFVLELFFYAFRSIRYPDRPEVRKRLRTIESDDFGEERQDLLKKRALSDIPILNQFLQRIPGMIRLDFVLKQANLKYTLGFFVLSSIVSGLTGYVLGSVLIGNLVSAVFIGMCLACLPFLYVSKKKKNRMAKFEKQLPEGLNLIARALRAGHAFTSGMKLASDEFDDPLGPEFQETLDEINFGMSVPDALKNLGRRLNCPDLKFFVVSVILQRETGGNLAEIIENLAHLMRERFKFRGKVRVLSAEGRLSAGILLAIPFLLFGTLFLVNREYVSPLMVDPTGKALVGGSVIMMILGIFVIKRIIKVDV